MKQNLHDALTEVKSSITARQVCDMYGLEINSSGFARCPWHDDTKPSLKVYDGQRGCYCFACNRGGSVVDLTMAIHNEPLRDATQRLVRDFNLNIEIDGNAKPYTPPPPDYRRLYQQELHDHAETAKDLARLVELVLGGQSAAIEEYVAALESRLYDVRRAS